MKKQGDDMIEKREIHFQKLKRVAIAVLGKENIDNMTVMEEHAYGEDNYLVKMFNYQLGNKYAEKVIRWPANWKEAFKERWFPMWLKKRFPIHYEERDAWLMLPDYLRTFALEKEKKGVTFYVMFEKPGRVR